MPLKKSYETVRGCSSKPAMPSIKSLGDKPFHIRSGLNAGHI